MSEYEDDDIDKIFEEIIGSEPIVDGQASNLVLKDLMFIAQSFARAIEHVNDIMLNLMQDQEYVIDEAIEEMLSSMYKISEDLDQSLVEFILEHSIELMFDDEETDDEGDE
jgi:hypothetical protein